jgi:hypothetical protein
MMSIRGTRPSRRAAPSSCSHLICMATCRNDLASLPRNAALMQHSLRMLGRYVFSRREFHLGCQTCLLSLQATHELKPPTDRDNSFESCSVYGYVSLIQILFFWTLSNVLFISKTPSRFYLKTQRFADWILSPSSGKTYSVGPNR